MKLASLAVFLAGYLASQLAQPRSVLLPWQALGALKSPQGAVLYSLEPLKWTPSGEGTLHGFTILGHTTLDAKQARRAADEFWNANKQWDGNGSDCFEPRHALRIIFGGHTYDFLLCFHCHELDVYRDDRKFTEVGASGSPQALNELLQECHLPVSHSDDGK